MCDYSLQNIASRPASVGDKLVTSKFTGAFSKGFAEAGSPELADTAICVLPGTEIAFDENLTTEGYYGCGEKTYEHKVGIFRQVDTEQLYTHHDALELPDGTIIKLNNLKTGLKATVLQLPAAPKTAEEAKEQTRLEVVA